jgi:hypothetical protein
VSIQSFVRDISSDAGTGALVIHVGFRELFVAGHIPGSVYAGPGGNDQGLKELEQLVSAQPKTRDIILYCGCCPWDHCPNVRPALALLRKLGFSRVRVLSIPHSFRFDWEKPGLPVERS